MDVDILYRRYGPMVMRRCRQLLRDEDQALDATQDVFVRLLTRRDRLRDDAPCSLLYRMATNLCLNRIRDDRRRKTTANSTLLEQIACWERHRGPDRGARRARQALWPAARVNAHDGRLVLRRWHDLRGGS